MSFQQPPYDPRYFSPGPPQQPGYYVPLPQPEYPPGIGPKPSGISLSDSKRQVIGAIEARRKTDEILPTLWIIIPVLLMIASIVISSALILAQISSIDSFEAEYYSSIAISYGLSAIPIIFIGILVYYLVQRQNEHYRREAQLRIGMLSFLRAAADTPEKQYAIFSEIATLNTIHSQANMSERQRSPIAWALVMISQGIIYLMMAIGTWSVASAYADDGINSSGIYAILGILFLGSFVLLILLILQFYLLYFLMKSFFSHDNRWYSFTQQVQWGLYKLGYRVGQPNWAPLPERSFALYFILSIFTAFLFVYYWWYVLIKDPNDHFKNQWYYEDQLIQAIGH